MCILCEQYIILFCDVVTFVKERLIISICENTRNIECHHFNTDNTYNTAQYCIYLIFAPIHRSIEVFLIGYVYITCVVHFCCRHYLLFLSISEHIRRVICCSHSTHVPLYYLYYCTYCTHMNLHWRNLNSCSVFLLSHVDICWPPSVVHTV